MSRKEMYYEITHEGEVVSLLTIRLDTDVPGVAEVHHTVYKWTLSVFKEQITLWETVRKSLKESGINKIVTLCPIKDLNPRVPKYWKMFGFNLIKKLDIWDTPVLYGEMEI